MYGGRGASIHLVSAEHLGLAGDVSTSDVVAGAQAHGLVAIGWRMLSAGGDVVLNPHEDERTVLAAEDEIVVVG
jgi:hypothetical protein